MHREYRPDDMHHGHGAGLGVIHADPADDERALIGFTMLLGGLVGLDVFLGLIGSDTGRFPLGLSPTMLAALLGAIYIVYGTLQSLLRGRIGADLALAQACLAALIIGQPFVAAEVVFIALLGEVLEAWTFAHARRAMGRLVDQRPRTARVRRGEAEVEIPADQAAIGDTVIVWPGERIPVDGTILVGPFDRRSIGADGRVAADRQGARRSGLHRDDQPVRCDRGRGREGGRRDDVRPGAPAGRPGPSTQGEAGEDGRPPGPLLPPRGGAGGRGHADHRLPRRLARRLVADGGRPGRRVPLRAGAGDAGGDAGQHGVAGAARRADQGGHGARGPGRLRYVRLRQDRDPHPGPAGRHRRFPDRRARRGVATAAGGRGRVDQPPPARRGGRRGGPPPIAGDARDGPGVRPARRGRPGRLQRAR